MATTIVTNTFDGGMTNDPRDTATNVARITKHVDNNNIPHLLTPYPDNDFVTGQPDTNTNFDSYRIQQFIYANYLSTPTFFGLGVQSTTVPAIYSKTSIGSAWALANTGGDYGSLTALGTGPKAFILYQSYLYGLDGGGWWKYGDITSSPTWTRQVDATQTGGTANLNVTIPIVHSKDDVMYVGGGAGTLTSNVLTSNNSGTWIRALTFSTYTQIVSICEYGNYLAIAVNNPNDTCSVYLWDRDSSLTTISEKIDWGSGQIKFIENIQGTLVGCSALNASSALSVNNYQVSFKYYNGQSAATFAEFTPSAVNILPFHQRFNNLVYFAGEMTIDSVALRGIWKIAKQFVGTITVSFDRLPRLDDTVTSGGLFGFLRTGDYFHIACLNAQDSDKYIVSKTNTSYTTTTIYRTPINPGMPPQDRTAKKKLISVSASFSPLAASEAMILKVRVDGGSFNTVFTDTTDNDTSYEMTCLANGTAFTDGREFEFSLEPSGGAKVTELKYRYEVETSQTV